jgi:hypothetical protein
MKWNDLSHLTKTGIAAGAVGVLCLTGCSRSTGEVEDASPTVTITTTVGESTAPTSPEEADMAEPSASKPAAGAVNPADYGVGGNYYFTSPSGKWQCAILAAQPDSETGCHGHFPDFVPRVPGSGAPDVMVAPNAVVMTTRNQKAMLISMGDARFYPESRNSRALPYGRALTVGPITCTIDETTGVSCDDTKTDHGFTVSETAVTLR